MTDQAGRYEADYTVDEIRKRHPRGYGAESKASPAHVQAVADIQALLEHYNALARTSAAAGDEVVKLKEIIRALEKRIPTSKA